MKMLTDLILDASLTPPSRCTYHGVRKIIHGVHWETDMLPTPDLESLMYKEAKIRQLLRNYHNAGEIETAREKLKARRDSAHTSVAVSTLGSAKDSRSQGFCLRQLIITQTPKWTEVDIIWRSTELIQKNTADYALIPLILEQLELAHTPRKYRLYMANAYVTALFMPLLFQNTDPIEYFEKLKGADPRYYKTALNAFAKFLEVPGRYSYKHRVKAQASAHEHLDLPRLTEYCKQNGASFIPQEF